MDIGRSFTFVFEDQQWLNKLLIGAAILFVGSLFLWLLFIPLIVAGALLNGYMIEIIRRVVDGRADLLPEWDEWGDMIVDGLKLLVVQIVYSLPAIVLGLCMILLLIAAGENAEVLGWFLGLGAGCFILLWTVAVSIVLPAATAVFAVTRDLTSAFQFGKVFAFVRDNLSTYLLTLVMGWVAGFIGSLGGTVCGLGTFFTVPYAYMVTGHLYGQAYATSADAGSAQ